VLVLLAWLLAGCSGDADDGGTGPDDEQPAAEDRFTDKVYLLKAAQLSYEPANLSEPAESAIPFGSTGTTWSMPIDVNLTLTIITAKVWVRVDETLVAPYADDVHCPFSFVVEASIAGASSRAGGGRAQAEPGCGIVGSDVDQNIAPGTYLMEATVDGGGMMAGAGSSIGLRIVRNAAGPGVDDGVVALAGTEEYDSHVQFKGLKLKVPGNLQSG
jgi:hypothetical protein